MMTSFNSYSLQPEILKALEELGFHTPTPVQEKTLSLVADDSRDLIALAQTGTGKTAAFGLPLINKLVTEEKRTQFLILCPTRELCIQIKDDLVSYSKYLRNCFITAVYGGASIQQQIRDIRRGTQIIVATPGRLMDLMDRGEIKLDGINTVVLDEADEMLNMGFKEAIDTILSETPENKSTWLFSATMPKEIRSIIKSFMENPIEIKVGEAGKTAQNIQHYYYIVKSHDKYSALKRIVDYNPEIYGLIFCRTKAETQSITDYLIRDGYNADALHGDLSQAQRDTVMNRFRVKTLQILVATDVAARGIDVDDITHVIQYTLPDETEVYTHRSGRTARAGKTGISIAMISPRESYRIRDLEKLTGSKFKAGLIPTGYQVCEKQLMHIIDSMITTEVNETEIEPFLSIIEEKVATLSKEDLVKRVASMEFNRFLKYYQDAPNLNYTQNDKGSSAGSGLVRLFIGLGEIDELGKIELIKLIAEETGIRFEEIRRVDVMRSFSFFEVDKTNVEKVKAAYANYTYRGRTIRVEEAAKKDGGGRDGGSRENRDGGGSRDGAPKRYGGDRERSGGGDRDRKYGGEKKYGGSRERSGGERSGSGERRSDGGGMSRGYGGERKKPFGKSGGSSSRSGSGGGFKKRRDD